VLHLGGPPSSQPYVPVSSSSHTEPSSTSSTLIAQDLGSDLVLLATATVLVQNRSELFLSCRALLDSGSQLPLVTSRFANQLQLKRSRSSGSVTGIGDSNFATDGFSVGIAIRSVTSDFSTSITAVIAPNIADRQPSFNVSPFFSKYFGHDGRKST